MMDPISVTTMPIGGPALVVIMVGEWPLTRAMYDSLDPEYSWTADLIGRVNLKEFDRPCAIGRSRTTGSLVRIVSVEFEDIHEAERWRLEAAERSGRLSEAEAGRLKWLRGHVKHLKSEREKFYKLPSVLLIDSVGVTNGHRSTPTL